MKSIFKKIALVLVLAMVVTMIPAKSASAASDDGPQMYKSLLLYLDSGNGNGSDITGNFQSERYASVWNWRESGYTKVDFESENPDIATVNSKGKVSAVKVGKTTVTAIFTGDDVKTVTKKCTVTVKRNAQKAGLSTASTKKVQEEGIKVGEEYQLVAVRKIGDDITVYSGRDQITDGVRFRSSDESIFTVGKTKGKITGVSEGTATLYVWAVQSEGYDAEKEEYPATTEVKEYTVKVVSSLKAEQVAYNAFDVTFSSEQEAEEAVKETSKYLASHSAAVTEEKNIVKVSEVVKDTKNPETKVGEEARIIGNLYQKSDNKKVVRVEMFDELKEGTDYVIRYKEHPDIIATTTKNVAAKLVVSAGASKVTSDNSSQTDIVVKLFAVGVNNQDVDITECRKYRGWQDSVEIYDKSQNQTGYNLVIGKEMEITGSIGVPEKVKSVAQVYFSDRNASITVQAAFYDYFNETKPGNPLTSLPVTIGAGDRSFVTGEILGYGVVMSGTKHTADKAFASKALATEDFGRQLIVKAKIIYKDGSSSEECNCCPDPSLFTFVSENEDKLVINGETGDLYAPKQPNDTYVNVLVYYDGQYIGVCRITIYAKRELTSFTMSVNKTKLSHNADRSKDVDEVVELTLKPLDQMEEIFVGAEVNVKMYGITSNNAYLSPYLKFYSDADCTNLLPNAADGQLSVNLDQATNTYKVWIKGTDDLPKAVRNIRILGTAVSSNNGTKKTLNASTSFNAKNTTGETARSYEVSTSTNSIDMNLNGDRTWKTNTDVRISAYSIDKDGFKIEHLVLDPGYSSVGAGSTGNVITVNQFGKYMQSANLAKAGYYDLVFSTVTGSSISAVNPSVVNGLALDFFKATGACTVTGGAIDAAKNGQMLEKIPKGNYQVSLYINAKYSAGSVISVDDKEKIEWSWKNHSLEYSVYDIGDVLSAIKDAFICKELPASGIYAGHITSVDAATGNATYVLKDDFVVQGEYVTIKQVRCLREDSGYYYEVIIPIQKTIKVVVIH